MLYLVRHAKDDESFVGSWSNISILPEEVEKVRLQAKFIKGNLNISKIISSDIKRAEETAQIIGQELKLPVELDSNLREQNKGELTGRNKGTLTEEEWDLIENQQIETIFPKGESLINVYERIKKYLETINQFQDRSLIVTHRGVINMIYYIVTKTPLDMDKNKFNVDHLSIHEYDPQKQMIRRIK